MKAIPAGTDALDSELESVYPGAEALLLDSVDNGKFGGTGRSFDFSKYPTGIGRNVFLAGGSELTMSRKQYEWRHPTVWMQVAGSSPSQVSRIMNWSLFLSKPYAIPTEPEKINIDVTARLF